MRRVMVVCLSLLLIALPVRAQSLHYIVQMEIEETVASGATELNLSRLGLMLEDLPAELWQLTHRERLRLDGNALKTLPDSISGLTSLQELHLDGNQLTSLPDSIMQLVNLRKLTLDDNQLTEIPETIGQLTRLEWLFVSRNALSYLPESIGQLDTLTYLSASENQLKMLPASMENLKNLKWVMLQGNQIRELPLWMGNLVETNIDGNPLVFPPPEIVSRGAILSYLRDYEQMQMRRLLVITGAGGVGLVAGFGLLWRWKMRRGTAKKKRA